MILTWLFTLMMSNAPAEPVAIYPLGDSITHGMDHDGYRRGLAARLRAAGVAFRFVGSLADGSPGFADRDHDGHDGWRTDHLADAAGAWLRRFRPDVVLLMIGSNDIETGADLPTLLARYRRLLDVVAADAPRAHVLVSEVSLIRHAGFDRVAVAFNRELASLVRERAAAGARLTFVPMHDALTAADLLDLDHPTRAGNDKLAERWWGALKPIVLK